LAIDIFEEIRTIFRMLRLPVMFEPMLPGIFGSVEVKWKGRPVRSGSCFQND
jgi:hypothetical protein